MDCIICLSFVTLRLICQKNKTKKNVNNLFYTPVFFRITEITPFISQRVMLLLVIKKQVICWNVQKEGSEIRGKNVVARFMMGSLKSFMQMNPKSQHVSTFLLVKWNQCQMTAFVLMLYLTTELIIFRYGLLWWAVT